MKILTLNTHSLVEDNYSQKLMDFVNAIAKEQPEIIALQEVNQTSSEAAVTGEISGYVPCGDFTVRGDNHVYNAAKRLEKIGTRYYWTWLPMKRGYDKYDEGIAVMSRSPIIETQTVLVSGVDDYADWKTRKLLGIRTEAVPDEWFFSVHYGWWNDPDEPFQSQWQRTVKYMEQYETVWLMGDFNSPAEVRKEGYDLANSSRFYDSYELAEKKDNGITVGKIIDGWRDKLSENADGMRIDHIRCSKKVIVTSSEVLFNGINYPVVSDHYGVMINYERILS